MSWGLECPVCIHRTAGTLACDAFPGGIPVAIASGEATHTKPFKGDQGIRFKESDGKISDLEIDKPAK